MGRSAKRSLSHAAGGSSAPRGSLASARCAVRSLRWRFERGSLARSEGFSVAPALDEATHAGAAQALRGAGRTKRFAARRANRPRLGTPFAAVVTYLLAFIQWLGTVRSSVGC